MNDQGGLQSSISSILGGIATNMGPEAAARAQELQEQTKGLDLANQLKRMTISGATGIPAVLGAANADPTVAPQPSTVPGALATVAQPPGPAPGTFGAANPTDSYSPMARLLAGSYAADPGMANVATGINLGKDITTGPGSDFPTANTEHIAAHAPVTISTGQTHIGDPTQPAVGANVITGGSPYTQSGETAGGTSDDALAARDLESGAAAKVTLGRADLMDQLYARLDQLGTNTPSEITKDLVVESLSKHLDLDLSRYSDVASMKNEIRTLGLGLTGTLKTTQGDPMPRGSLDAIQAMAADPNTPPEQFHRMISVIKNVAKGEADNYDAALKFRTDRPKIGDQAGIDYHTARGNNAATQGKALEGLGAPTTPAYPPIPRSAVTRLQANPALRGDFDKMFGPGAAARVLGE